MQKLIAALDPQTTNRIEIHDIEPFSRLVRGRVALLGDAGDGPLNAVAAALRPIADIERIAGRVALFSARPRDLSSLRDSLHRLAELRAPLLGTASPLLSELLDQLATPDAALDLLSAAILPEPSALLREGGVIANGYDTELDELRGINDNCGAYLVELEARERERTGIANLRVRDELARLLLLRIHHAGECAGACDFWRVLPFPLLLHYRTRAPSAVSLSPNARQARHAKKARFVQRQAPSVRTMNRPATPSATRLGCRLM
mgnify:CR=1 FL=1